MNRRIISLMIVAGLTTIGLGATACGKKPPPTPPLSPSPASSDNVTLNRVKQQYTQALSRAKDWQSNATLARVFRQYNGTLTPDEPLPLTFSFASLADPNQAFLVEVAENSIRERKSKKEGFELSLAPINLGAWQVDPDRALGIAESSGGQKFRDQHLAGYKVLLQLSQVKQYPLQWYVRYDTGDGSRQRLEIFVNATNGQVDQQRQSTT